MRIVRENELVKFAERHPNIRASLNHWAQLIRAGSFKSIIELRETFGRVSPVKVRPKRFNRDSITLTVFNISGNDARLIAVVQYTKQVVIIDQVLTHDEYDTGNWRK
ncbi:MAG: type II toxin-antitoxin system HigB family toxin [Candidatus Poribacteria bacterium]|nr:type II toxin-antitoxin system HigB family toxin [Candidatus Poribacteria bacterium]